MPEVNAAKNDPDDNAPLDVFYRLGNKHYFVRYSPVLYNGTSYSTDFKAFEVTGWSIPTPSTPTFGDNHLATDNPVSEQVTPFISGRVKWDGCTNFDFNFPENGGCMLHECDREGLVNIGLLLGRIWDQCAALCPTTIDYMKEEAQPVVADSGFPWEAE